MKKVLSLIFCAILCAGLFAFVGCSDDKKECEGIYYFHDGSGTLNYNTNLFTWYNEGNANPYPYVVGGFANFNLFYIELKDGKMTVHGSITHTEVNGELKIIAKSDIVREYEYTLVKPEGKYGYSIYADGEDTGYSVSPPQDYHVNDYDDGYISFEFGSFDSLHIIYNWTKTRIEFPEY